MANNRRSDHPRDCFNCYSNVEHAVLDYTPMTDQELFEAVEASAYLLGNSRAANVSSSNYSALSRALNNLALIADDRYQAARKAGR